MITTTMTQHQKTLVDQANQILREANCRWDGRNRAAPRNAEKAKAQAAFERAMVCCPFSGRSKRKN